jgi:hypothetical protein
MVVTQITGVEWGGFIIISSFMFLLASALTVLSYGAYRRTDHRSLRPAILGFGVLTMGISIQKAYHIFINGSFLLGARELFMLEGLEASVLLVSFGLLMYSVTKY